MNDVVTIHVVSISYKVENFVANYLPTCTACTCVQLETCTINVIAT